MRNERFPDPLRLGARRELCGVRLASRLRAAPLPFLRLGLYLCRVNRLVVLRKLRQSLAASSPQALQSNQPFNRRNMSDNQKTYGAIQLNPSPT